MKNYQGMVRQQETYNFQKHIVSDQHDGKYIIF